MYQNKIKIQTKKQIIKEIFNKKNIIILKIIICLYIKIK